MDLKLCVSSFQPHLDRSNRSWDEGVMIKTVDRGQAAKLGRNCLSCQTSFGRWFFNKRASQIWQEVYQEPNVVLGSWTKGESSKKHQGSLVLVKLRFPGQTGKAWPCRIHHCFWLPSKPKISYMRPTWIHKHVGRSKESEDGVQIRIHKLHWRRNHWANRKESWNRTAFPLPMQLGFLYRFSV